MEYYPFLSLVPETKCSVEQVAFVDLVLTTRKKKTGIKINGRHWFYIYCKMCRLWYEKGVTEQLSVLSFDIKDKALIVLIKRKAYEPEFWLKIRLSLGVMTQLRI